MSPVRLRLDDILRERKITQIKLAEMAGLSENSISKLTGSPRQVRMDSLDKICRALDLEPGDLFIRTKDVSA